MAGRKSRRNIIGNNQNDIWKVGIYCRLSSDDGDNAEADSITNQRELISLYLKQEKNFKIIDYYIDDGYSGTTFARPDFKRLIRDITNEKINTIIVKDLSRFGRNYIEVGRYIEDFFPIYNVRFIAINDKLEEIKKNISKYSRLKSIVREDYATNIIKEEEYKDYIKDYNERLEQLENEKEEVLKQLNSSDLKIKKSEEWINKFEKTEHIEELDNVIINELIDDIQIHEDGSINIIFKYQDEFIETIDFIKKEKYDIMLKNVV